MVGVAASLSSACGGTVQTGTGSGGAGSGPGSGVTTTGATTTSATSTSGSSMSTTTSTSTSSSSSGGACDASNCAAPFKCCGSLCVNPNNDILNCGTCGKVCGGTPYCDQGTCGTAPCNSPALCGPAGQCCGMTCCKPGEICCDVPGPVASGPKCQAPDPTTHTCDKGCPLCKCASPDTPIATPGGDRPIADLAVGDLVYSVDRDAVVIVPIARIHRTPVRDHRVVRVSLASGAILEISALHPTADGGTFGTLRVGQSLDGVRIMAVESVPYGHPFTYDILPASGTGTYYAGGARIGSTLSP